MLFYILYPVNLFIINENTFLVLSLVGRLSLIIQTCFQHFCIVSLLTLHWTKKEATHNRKMSGSGKKKGCFFQPMPATKIQQLKGDIAAHHYIYCSSLSSCTPTSEKKETAPCEAPFHFNLVLLVSFFSFYLSYASTVLFQLVYLVLRQCI